MLDNSKHESLLQEGLGKWQMYLITVPNPHLILPTLLVIPEFASN